MNTKVNEPTSERMDERIQCYINKVSYYMADMQQATIERQPMKARCLSLLLPFALAVRRRSARQSVESPSLIFVTQVLLLLAAVRVAQCSMFIVH